MDVTTVTAVTAATAQTATAPASIDAVFGALLQSVTDSAAAAAPNIMALLTPAPQTTQDTVAPVTSDLAATLLLNQQTTTPLPDQQTNQQNTASGQDALAISPTHFVAPMPAQINTSAPQATVEGPQPPVIPQQAAPAEQAPTAEQTPAPTTAEPLPAPPTTQVASQGTNQSVLQPVAPDLPQPATQPTPQPVGQPIPSVATPPVSQAVEPSTPTPQNGMADAVRPAAQTGATQKTAARDTKTKAAAEPQPDDTKQSSDAASDNNPVIDVLAGFLMAQIEPAVVPANDSAPDSENKIASVTEQPSAPSQQPQPENAVVPPVAPQPAPAPSATKESGPQIAALGSEPTTRNGPIAPDTTPTGEDGSKKAAPQAAPQAGHQTATSGAAHSPGVQQPSSDTAAPLPDVKPAVQPAPETRVQSEQAPATSATNTSSAPAQHQVPNAVPVAQPIPTAAQSGLRKLSAGLQIVAQQQDATATLDKLGVTIATKMVEGTRQFDIRLDPPELGRVDVRLTMDDSGKAHANLVVDKPQTLELLQRDAPALNRALSDAGLDLSNNGLNFSLREQHRQNDGGVDQGRGRSLSAKTVVQTDAIPIHSSLGSYAPNSVRLDIRV